MAPSDGGVILRR